MFEAGQQLRASLGRNRVFLGFAAVLALSLAACGEPSNGVARQGETLLTHMEAKPLPTSRAGGFHSSCSNPEALRVLQFGPAGRTVLATCGIQAPFSQVTEPTLNLNALTFSYFRSDYPTRSSTRVYDVATGDVLFELAPLTAAGEIRALLPLLRSTGARPWLVGTAYDNGVANGAVITGAWSTELTTIPSAHGWVSAVAQIDSDTIAVLYHSRPPGLDTNDFPPAFVARVNIQNGEILSDEKLEMPEANYFVSGASFEETRLTVFYTAWPRGEGYRDFYGGASSSRSLSVAQFDFVGAALGAPRTWSELSARHVVVAPDFLLLGDANSPTCPAAAAIMINHSWNILQCFRRTDNRRAEDTPSSSRPNLEEHLDYRATTMDSGRYAVILGEVGLDDPRFGSDEQQTAHVYDARGAYIGSIAARSIGVAMDAPLLATVNVRGEGAVLRIGN